MNCKRDSVRRWVIWIGFVCIFLLLGTFPVSAQDDAPELFIKLRRDFGYGGFKGDIQGKFTLIARGPEDLVKVEFFIDGERLGEVFEAPYQVTFNTGSYPTGIHTFTAVGTTKDGTALASNEIRSQFVTASEGWQEALKLIIPILAATFGLTALSFVFPFLIGNRKKLLTATGKPRQYGLLGGAICPKCSEPFALHFLRMNLVVGRLDRCPYCGKWSVVRRASPAALAGAEAAAHERSKAVAAGASTAGGDIRSMLDDTRYYDI